MKRFIGVALCTALALVVAGSALADTSGWGRVDLVWRTHKTNSDGIAATFDSTFCSGTGAISDTTAAFPMSWSRASGGVALDTLTAFVFALAPQPTQQGGLTAALGTHTVVLQVSADGIGWVTTGTLSVTEQGSTNTIIKGYLTDGLVGPDPNSFWGWPLGRFTTTHDSSWLGEFYGYVRGPVISTTQVQ